MLSNFHTHTNFCDGKDSPETIVCYAIEKGFSSLGFSGHGYTEFDLNCCINDTKGYCDEIKRLKEKYKDKIQIYLGVEEDAFAEVNRSDFEYIIGSSHYFNINGKYYPVDASRKQMEEYIGYFGGDVLNVAKSYYETFCEYILRRKPDIIGHFDLLTKFDEIDEPIFLNNKKYSNLAGKYLNIALKAECIFEVNTGAISRGYRKSPYPSEDLLYILKKNDAKLILSSDSHSFKTLDFGLEEARKLLKNIGFECVYTLDKNRLVKDFL